MTRTSQLAMSTAISWAFLAPAAFADLTPAQVWGDWRDYMQGLGYTVNATETDNGGDLSVSDINVNINMGADAGNMTMSMGAMTFTDAGDGSVNIVMPDSMPMSVIFSPAGEKPATITMSFDQSGQSLNVSGDPQNLTYAYAAATAGFSLDKVEADGITFGPDVARFNFSANDLTSTTVMTIGDARDYDQNLQTGAMTYEAYFKSPDGPEQMDIKGQMASMTFAGTSNIPMGVAVAGGDMSKLLNAGFGVDGAFTFGGGNYDMTINDTSGNGKISGTSGGGNLSVKMGPDGIAYGGGQTDLKMDMQIPDLPFPISLAMAKNGFNLVMPIQKSEEAQDFALSFDMTDFTMSDVIWGLFDPTAQLPRDPATVALDLSGKAKLLFDLMDPKSVEQMEASGAAPGEVEAVTINSLLVSAAGAKVAGTGDFTFDNTDMTTVPGMPKPVGSIDLSVNGANGLIDKLIAMGMLPEEQAMGARMMMGMLAVPGAEPDSLTSKIEMTDDGQILANGQRIK